MRNFTSANFQNSNLSFALLKYCLALKLFAQNFAKFHAKFGWKIRENKEQNSPNYVCITFAQYCRLKDTLKLQFKMKVMGSYITKGVFALFKPWKETETD